ncbi:MAG: TolC family protein [Planctomycetes bacterium]|nr:TolC family protein [Planctomycetota bacterium]
MPKSCFALFVIVTGCLLFAGCGSDLERDARHDMQAEAQVINLQEGQFGKPVAINILLSDNPDLSEYLRYAAIHNHDLRAAFYEWQAALEKVPQAQALPDPKLSYTNYIEEVETRVGPQKNRYMLMQMLPWPTKITGKSDLALRQALVQQYVYETKKLALFYQVKKAYYEYYYLHKSIQVINENIQLLQSIDESLQTKYKTGSVDNHTLLQTQVELGKLEDHRESLQALQAVMASRLNAALGRSVGLPLPWPVVIEKAPRSLVEEEILASLLQDNPGLQAAREKIHAADAGVSLAHAEYFPDFGLGASVIETDRRTDMDPNDNGKDPVMLTLELSLPLWWNKYNAGMREAEARRNAAREELEAKTLMLSSDLQLAFYNYQDANRRQKFFQDTLIPKAEQALASAQTAFATGETSFTDLINAERNLLELRLMVERALVDNRIHLAELEKLAGRNLRLAADTDVATESD